MTTKSKKNRFEICLAMSVCLLLIQGGTQLQTRAASITGWGYNNFGQATPPAGNDFVAIAAGAVHSLALRADGSVVGWGRNQYDQITTPTGYDFKAIAAGNYHCLALKTDGSVVGWGANDYG
ncbi:MAG: dockerin type I domain-containing protein, partial [Planctomycetota bacterium]